MTERSEQRPAQSEAVEKKSTMLTVQVLWVCQAFNATPEEAARTVVSDLFEQLAQGGAVTVHIEDADGKEQTLEVSAG